MLDSLRRTRAPSHRRTPHQPSAFSRAGAGLARGRELAAGGRGFSLRLLPPPLAHGTLCEGAGAGAAACVPPCDAVAGPLGGTIPARERCRRRLPVGRRVSGTEGGTVFVPWAGTPRWVFEPGDTAECAPHSPRAGGGLRGGALGGRRARMPRGAVGAFRPVHNSISSF